jgi:restriction endonuclease Mrr
MGNRADRIEQVLREAGSRLEVAEIAKRISKLEGTAPLNVSVVSATVSQDNAIRDRQGRTPRFNNYGDGNEKHGYVSLRSPVVPTRISSSAASAATIPAFIETANSKIREQVKAAVSKLSWQEFESNFLSQILEALGFNSVEITQPTRDGGKDAICRYRRGIVNSEAFVSAKHWGGGKRVAVDEVQRLRGLRGNADTGIIVTSSEFTQDAKREAEPSQHQRTIVLIDGDLIVDTCMQHAIGVKPVNLPTLYQFVGFKEESE